MRFIYGKPGNLQRPYCCDGFEVFCVAEFLVFIDGISFRSETNSSVLQGEARAVAPGAVSVKSQG